MCHKSWEQLICQNDIFANLVDTTIASPLLSWLKGAPPGINPSSRQQKKKELRTASHARSSINLKTERQPSSLVGSCSCVEQKVCWRSDLGQLCLGVVAERLFGLSSNPGASSYISMSSLLQGFPSTSPGYILGTNLGTRLLVPVEQCDVDTAEDRAEGASFWYAFLTPFWGPKKIFFFKRHDAEAYVWPKSDTREAQQKLRSNLTQHN